MTVTESMPKKKDPLNEIAISLHSSDFASIPLYIRGIDAKRIMERNVLQCNLQS